MRRLSYLKFGLLLFLCALLLAACQPQETEEVTPVPTPAVEVTPVTAAPAPVEKPLPSAVPAQTRPSWALEYVPYDTLVDTPPTMIAYQPEVNVFPLINTISIYMECVKGAAAFVDKDGNLYDTLPEGIIQYYAVNQVHYEEDNWTAQPQCIELVNADNKVAIMTLDGNMVTGFDYDMYFGMGEDSPAFQVSNGYFVVSKLRNGVHKLGLLDIRTGGLAIPCEYDRMELCGSTVYAQRGATAKLLDFTGNTLFDFGSNTLDSGAVVYTESDEMMVGDSFMLIDAPKMFGLFKTNHAADVTLYRDGCLPILVKNQHEANAVITVVKEDSSFVYAAKGELQFWRNPDSIVISHDNRLTAITPDGQIYDFGYAVGGEYVYDAVYKEGYIYAKLALDYNVEEMRMIAPDGQYTVEEIDSEISLGRIRFRSDETGFEAAYYNDAGKQLIPYGTYTDFREVDSEAHLFIVACQGERGVPAAIFNGQGTLLLDNVYGVISELFTKDRLVVYRSANDCGFLNSKGDFTPITQAPPVEKVYYGG